MAKAIMCAGPVNTVLIHQIVCSYRSLFQGIPVRSLLVGLKSVDDGEEKQACESTARYTPALGARACAPIQFLKSPLYYYYSLMCKLSQYNA